MKDDIATPRQIIQRIGRNALCKLLDVSVEAPRKWYAKGIPTKHWPRLVKTHGEWLSYQLLERANDVARRPLRRR